MSSDSFGIFSGPRRHVLKGALALLSSPWVNAADPAPEGWPTKPIKMIIPFPPGQATDIYGRLLAERLSALWRQGVVVENRPGASSIIGMEAIKNSPPDGYTLGMVSSGPLAINPALF